MSSSGVTLCTYTYNDAAFVRELLAGVGAWNVRPDAVVVVDDGSASPFEPGESPIPLRVIRLDPNCGITEAKRTGLSAPETEYIFSMDADVRVSPNYLETCLRNIHRPGVGLTAGAVRHAAGNDLVSRYLQTFGDNHNLTANGPMDFIPGNAFLLASATWKAVGGFGDYQESVCEDHQLCKRIRAHGQTLWSDCTISAWQTRRISRHAHCMRVWKWLHRSHKAQLATFPGDRGAVVYLHEILLKPLVERVEEALRLNESLFIYLELLYLSFTVLDMLDFARIKGLVTPELAAGFPFELRRRLVAYRRLGLLWEEDLRRAGKSLHGCEAVEPETEQWSEFFALHDSLEQSGFLAWLNGQGVLNILADESKTEYAFSSYSQASFT
ncbi:glycosyltransferase family 2 protein [Desulfocurvibacter africanus]|uniref:glycosyltransferase family 2 protein n=1 Tax=Desulfocurvibacter africanus TaxID=873 RepID=UPI00042982AD|nr:glycosyltransferase family 2 protein [Desulfocurvibacter africanus]